MPGLVPGIHVLEIAKKNVMAGTSPTAVRFMLNPSLA